MPSNPASPHLADEVEAIESSGLSGAMGRAARKERGNLLKTIWSVAKVLAAVGVYVWIHVALRRSGPAEATPETADDLALEVMDELAEPEPVVAGEAPSEPIITASPSPPATALADEPPPDAPRPEAPRRADEAGAPPVEVLVFLERMEEKVRRAREALEAQERANSRRESILFGALLCTALLTAAIAVAAFFLILTGRATVGAVSGALALVTGAGTLNLRRLWAEVKGREEELRAHGQEHDSLLEAIEFTLAVPDRTERERQTAELATRLQTRAFEARAARLERASGGRREAATPA